MAVLRTTRKGLKSLSGRDFYDGDDIFVSKYIIHIKYGKYNIPMASWVETIDGKILDCTPGIGWPYYIDDFLHR